MSDNSGKNWIGKYKACVFDWDGTLVNSERHIVESLSYAAERMYLHKLSYAQLKDIIGLGMEQALLTLYPKLMPADIQKMRGHYAEFYFSVPQDQSILFKYVIETLDQLQCSGVKLAVATGKSRHGLDKALQGTGLGHYFQIERCADETRSKPDPLMLHEIATSMQLSPGEMLMVGDTEYDLAMARNYGMDSIGVSYGVHESSRLATHQPIAIIDCFSELVDYVS